MKHLKLLPILISLPLASYADEFIDDLEGKDHSGWFVGGKLGTLATSFEAYTEEVNPAEEKVESDNNSSMLGVYFGYNFTNWFGLEAELSITGDADEDLINQTTENDAVESAAFASLRIQPKFTWQITDNFGLYSKAGFYRAAYSAEIDYISSSSDYDYNYTSTQTWSGNGWTAGIGAQFAVVAGLTLRLAYDYSAVELESDDSDIFYAEPIDTTVSELGLGVHYQF